MKPGMTNAYTFKNQNEHTEVYIQNNTKLTSRKKQMLVKPKQNESLMTEQITRQTIQTQERSPKLNKSELIKGVYRGMFSYSRTSKSVESSPYHQYSKQLTEINLNSCNILKERVNRKNTYDTSFKDLSNDRESVYSNIRNNNILRDSSPLNNSMYDSQNYFFKNISIEKYLVPSPVKSIPVSNINREESMSSFKFDLSKFKAGSSKTIESNNTELIHRENAFERQPRSFNTSKVNAPPEQFVRKLSNTLKNKSIELTDIQKHNRRMLIELVK
jgi:hypothetical protein